MDQHFPEQLNIERFYNDIVVFNYNETITKSRKYSLDIPTFSHNRLLKTKLGRVESSTPPTDASEISSPNGRSKLNGHWSNSRGMDKHKNLLRQKLQELQKSPDELLL